MAQLDVVKPRPADRGCCGPSTGQEPVPDDADELRETVRVRYAKAAQAAQPVSLGCGNPTAVAELREGEVVLDLGSGGGIDVLLSAGRVGPSGKAYGLDMTDEMLELARDNQATAGVENVEFVKARSRPCRCPTTRSM